MPERGGRRHRSPPPRPVLVSKKLSWLLRHGATEENLALREGGYALVSDVLANRKIRSLRVTFDELTQIVQDNDKQRFAMVPTPHEDDDDDDDAAAALHPQDPRHWMIRATQGHSLKLQGGADALLTPITTENTPTTVVHGTTHRAWPLIEASGGLKPMGRTHVHFASGLPAGFKTLREANPEGDATAAVDAPVISGMRKSSTVLVFLDLAKAIRGGLQFGFSQNGVILTEGNSDGLVPLEYFSRVEDRTGHGVLVEDGLIVQHAPDAWAAKPTAKRTGQS